MIALERIHRRFEILRNHALDRIAVQPDQLAQEIDRKHGRSARFFIDDDLGQNGAGDVVPRFRIDHFEITPFANHRGKPVQSDVG